MPTRKIIDAFVNEPGLTDRERQVRAELARQMQNQIWHFCAQIRGQVIASLTEERTAARAKADSSTDLDDRFFQEGIALGVDRCITKTFDIFQPMLDSCVTR